MDQFDRLPPEARRWIAAAALPWSAQSVRRLWDRLHRETGGDLATILARLDAAERRMLMRDDRTADIVRLSCYCQDNGVYQWGATPSPSRLHIGAGATSNEPSEG
ncbi:DUF6525 family protein [Falsirhodobacter algicola]|uniref:DUF6525 family protein n=1 Tax=Falsirhodobacter algicola TaxID=2692330 RepID=UPI0028BEE8C8|nr:DUF6525 family protein [Falsirhodobacter algicola]